MFDYWLHVDLPLVASMIHSIFDSFSSRFVLDLFDSVFALRWFGFVVCCFFDVFDGCKYMSTS